MNEINIRGHSKSLQSFLDSIPFQLPKVNSLSLSNTLNDRLALHFHFRSLKLISTSRLETVEFIDPKHGGNQQHNQQSEYSDDNQCYYYANEKKKEQLPLRFQINFAPQGGASQPFLSLTCLHLNFLFFLRDSELSLLLKHCPLLEDLSLLGCRSLLFSPTDCFLLNAAASQDDPRSLHQKRNPIPALKSLDLSATNLTNEALDKMVQIYGPTLVSLKLRSCACIKKFEFVSGTLRFLDLRSNPNLQELKIEARVLKTLILFAVSQALRVSSFQAPKLSYLRIDDAAIRQLRSHIEKNANFIDIENLS